MAGKSDRSALTIFEIIVVACLLAIVIFGTIKLRHHAAGEPNRAMNYQDAALLNTVASAYAVAGRFDEAIKTSETALALAEADKNIQLAAQIRKNIETYKQQSGNRTSPHSYLPKQTGK